MHALKPAPPAAVAPGLSAGGADAPPVPGASAQLVRVRAAAQTNAPTSVRWFFTYCLLGERVHNFLGAARALSTLAARGIFVGPTASGRASSLRSGLAPTLTPTVMPRAATG